MKAELFDATLEAYCSKVPFHPFTVTLTNGDRFEVDFPKALAFREGNAVFFGPRGIPVIFDHEGTNSFIGDLMAAQTGEN